MRYVLCLRRWVGPRALYDRYDLPPGLSIRAVSTEETVSSLPCRCLASHATVRSLDASDTVDRVVGRNGSGTSFRMKQISIRQDTVCVLTTVSAKTADSVRELVRQVGHPVVVKPRYGIASRGVADRASIKFRDQARRNSGNGRPLAADRGAWIIAQAEIEMPTVYWSSAIGIYEGSKTRMRLRSTRSFSLHRDVSRYIEGLCCKLA